MPLTVLGVETSCDDTAVAVVRRHDDGAGVILAERLIGQNERHRPYGGIVPEIAARRHLDVLDDAVKDTLADADLQWDDLDAVAATAGPGLIGGLLVGLAFVKALAAARHLPFLAVNHLEAHALTARLTDRVAFPYLLLLISGGHGLLAHVRGLGRYRTLGVVRDDAPGEAFDKAAKALGLPQPGGPSIERCARNGDPERLRLPVPMAGRDDCDFSFSGLKTALRRWIEKGAVASQSDVADAAAAFQKAVADAIEDRCRRAMAAYPDAPADPSSLPADPPNNARQSTTAATAATATTQRRFVAAGGVAANQTIRERLSTCARRHDMIFTAPPPRLCTDNGVMIAWTALERLAAGERGALDAAARPRWPLESMSPPIAPPDASASQS